MIEGALKKKDSKTLIDIIVTTGARDKGISGFDEWRKRLVLRTKEKPIEGRANAAILRFFAELLGVSHKNISIIAGEKSTQKTLEVDKEMQEVTVALKNFLGQD